MSTREKKVEPEESRIKGVAQARTIFERYTKDNEKRAASFAQVRNQLEGGRPMDPAKMERDGTAWSTNVNFGDAAAAFDRTYLPYWKMVHDVPRKVALTIHSRASDADRNGVAMAEAFDLFIEDWGVDYFFNFMLCSSDFVKFGPGYVMWGDKDSPRYKHVRTEQMLFPKRTKANPDEWEVVALSREVGASELYKKIRTPKATGRSNYVGWNVAAVKATLAAMKNGGTEAQADDYTKIQDDLVNNDIGFSCENAPIELCYLWVREYSGKICSYVFTKSEACKDQFLYKSDSHSPDFRNIFGPIFYGVGSGGLIHSIKGFGVKNYYFSMLSNRMKSRLMDSGIFALSLNFTRDEDTPEETPPIENYGAVNVFPKGMTQMGIYPQIQAGQSVVESLERNQSENNAMYREQRKQIGETETATQANLLAALSGELSEATASLYLAQVGENQFKEMFRRLRQKGSRDPDAVKFVKRCRERGVPNKVIFDAEISVKTGANASTASAAIRDMIFKELLGMINLPGVNRRWILENYFANKLGAQSVSRALLPEGQQSDPFARKIAILENTSMGSGIPVPADQNEAHVEHVDEHLKPLENILGAVKQGRGQITGEHLVALEVALPHIEAHMAFLEADESRKAEAKHLNERFRLVQSITNGLAAKLKHGAPA